MRSAILALVLTFGVVLTAQDAAAPTLTDDQRTKIANIELKAENYLLKIEQLKNDLAKLQTEATVYLQSLKKDGYMLGRDANGTWVYQVESAKPK